MAPAFDSTAGKPAVVDVWLGSRTAIGQERKFRTEAAAP
jgi:hypothetical protein